MPGDASREAAQTEPVVICVAPTGARRTKADHPALPVDAAEIAREAAACADAGARVIHLHVRDSAGVHSLDPEAYAEAIDAIRDRAADSLIVQITTEAAGRYTPDEQMALVRKLRPEAASLAVRELIPATAEREARLFLEWAADARIALQFIVYDPEEAARVVELVRRGVVPGPSPHALFVVGRYGMNQRASARDLLPFLHVWPPDWPWTVCAFGPEETRCIAAAIALGGHVRVGFENNLHLPDGSVARDNAQLVTNARTLARSSGRRLADLAAARRIYGV